MPGPGTLMQQAGDRSRTLTDVQRRLKAGLARGGPRRILDVGASIGTPSLTSAITSPVVIARTDTRIHKGGGKFLPGTLFPYTDALVPQANTVGDPTATSSFGLPANRRSNSNFYEILIPAAVTNFEIILRGNGDTQNWFLDVDGIGTNTTGYTAPSASTGSRYYVPVTVPANGSNRLVRVTVGSTRPFCGYYLPTGTDILSHDHIDPLRIAVPSDSIGQGSVATTIEGRFVNQLMYRMGASDYINLGVGGSGYDQPAAAPVVNGYDLLERIGDVQTAFDGGYPDAMLSAAGINDIGVIQGAGSYTPAQIADRARTLWSTLRAGDPNMVIFALGIFTDYNQAGYNSWLQSGSDALFEVARSIPYCYPIDISGMVTLANRGTVFNGTVNGPHPVDAGHTIYANYIFNEIANTINRF